MATESGILFINKSATSKSLSRSNGAERGRIFRHVQQSRSEQSVKAESSQTTQLHSPPVPIVWQLTLSNGIATSNSSTGMDIREAKRSKKCSPETSKHCLTDRGHSPLITIGLDEFDPFNTTAAPISPYMKHVLDFYKSSMLEQVFPNKSTAEASLNQVMSYATHDIVALNAILCSTTGALYCHSQDEGHRFHAFYFSGQTIRHLKKELSKPENEGWKLSTLYAVSLLLWIECFQGDLQAVDAHIRGLDFLIKRVLSIDEHPLPIMSTILSSYYYCMAMLRRCPEHQPAIPDESLLSKATLKALAELRQPTKACIDPKTTRIPHMLSSFDTQSTAHLLSHGLKSILRAQQRCLQFNALCSSGLLSPPPSDISIMYQLRIRTDYDLLALSYTTKTPLTPIQEAVRLALYIITQPISSIAPTGSAFSRSMCRQLKAALERSNLEGLWWPCTEMFVWVLFVGCYIARGQEEWLLCLSHMAMAVEAIGIESKEELEKVLQRFVYIGKFHREMLESVWKDVEASRLWRSGQDLAGLAIDI